MQKQTKWLIGLIALLVVVNIALVATIWLKKEDADKPPRRDARNYLVKELQLDEKQERAFDSLRRGHFERMSEYKNAMRFVKDRLFSLLSEKDSNEIKKQITGYLKEKIGEIQGNIDIETFTHFNQFRSLLNAQQQQRFDTTIQEVLRTMAPPQQGSEGPPPHHLKNNPPPDKPPH